MVLCVVCDGVFVNSIWLFLMPSRIALIVHRADSTAGRIERELRRMGYVTELVHACNGEPFPLRNGRYSGCVIFGGPMSVYDEEEFPFLRSEKMWIEQALKCDMPILGICLGAQLIAQVLGAKVELHPDGYSEIGYHFIHGVDKGVELFGRKLAVYQWHSYGFGIPSGGLRLATSGTFDNQAFVYQKNVYAIQFHPEVTGKTIKQWTVGGADKLSWKGAQSRDDQIRLTPKYQPHILTWLRQFLACWLSENANDHI